MIKIDGDNFSPSFLKEKYGELIGTALQGVKSKYKENMLGFIDLDINNQVDKINSFVSLKKGLFDNIIILGIGGSALGARAILTAIKGKFYNELKKEKRNNYPTLHILDNVDPVEIYNLLEVIDLKRSLFIVISKSGSTVETISQFNFFKGEIEKLGLSVQKHFVIIAGENSQFKEKCLDGGYDVFGIPENVGGRFSVLTNVGLLPLAFAGIDIKGLLDGLASMKENFLSDDIEENLPLYIAIVQYYSYIELKKNITIFYPYVSNLNYFSHWYKQLVGESLAKGGIGITLVDSIGVTDQHSQLQLYYDGPEDKLIIFIELEKFSYDYKISDKITFGNLMNLEKKGVEESFNQKGKLNITIKIDKLDEKTLGQMIFLFEMQTAFLGEMYDVNAFNQPGVEECKKVMNKILNESDSEYFVF